MKLNIQLWCVLTDYHAEHLKDTGGLCLCVIQDQEDLDGDGQTLREVAVKAILLNRTIDKPGLWSVHLSSEDHALNWLGHFRVYRNMDGDLDIADELFPAATSVNVTRWPPKQA